MCGFQVSKKPRWFSFRFCFRHENQQAKKFFFSERRRVLAEIKKKINYRQGSIVIVIFVTTG